MSSTNTEFSRPAWATDEALKELDAKLATMTNTVGPVFTSDEVDLFRSYLGRLGKKSARSSEETCGESTIPVIQSLLEDGFCYLYLLASLPAVSDCSPTALSHAIKALKKKLGPNADGTDFLTELVMVNRVLSGKNSLQEYQNDDSNMILSQADHIRTLQEIMKSKCTFTMTEDSGLIHLTSATATCDCNEIVCDHGWATRFILSLLTRDGCKIGGEPRLEDILGPGFEFATDEDYITDPDDEEDTKPQNVPSLTRELESDMVNMVSDHLSSRTMALEEALRQLKEESVQKKSQEALQASPYENSSAADSGEETDTIMPLDSSTNLGRYTSGKIFMRKGSVSGSHLAPEVVLPQRLKTKPVTKLQGSNSDDMVRDVIRGFLKTPKMIKQEQEEVAKVGLINGLAAPFSNPRLNFLMHFHTALEDVMRSGEPRYILEAWADLLAQNPTEELLKVVVNRTFDFHRNIVKTNIFKLPYIEVGMELSDRNLIMCFDMLHNEYRSLWFQNMKCLSVPSFAQDFEKQSKTISTRNSRSSKRRTNSSSTEASSTSSSTQQRSRGYTRERQPSSVLGIKFK